MSLLAYLVALVLFLLAALGVSVGGADTLELVAYGLAALVLGHLLPW